MIMRNNGNNNGDGQQLEFLDILTIVSFCTQLSNMSQDEQQTTYINNVIKAISNEIEELHEENNIIIAQNKEIIDLIKNLQGKKDV
jgi:hypothetical protein